MAVSSCSDIFQDRIRLEALAERLLVVADDHVQRRTQKSQHETLMASVGNLVYDFIEEVNDEDGFKVSCTVLRLAPELELHVGIRCGSQDCQPSS